MVSAGASASAIALVTSPRREQQQPRASKIELPFRPGDRWAGWYHCNQGRTDLLFVFEDVRQGERDSVEVEVIFELHFDGKGNPGFRPADGAARMTGKYDPKTRRLRLEAKKWIEQPAGYQLVTFVGTIDETSYKGTVEGPRCSSFMAEPEHVQGRTPEPKATSSPSPIPRPRPAPTPRVPAPNPRRLPSPGP